MLWCSLKNWPALLVWSASPVHSIPFIEFLCWHLHFSDSKTEDTISNGDVLFPMWDLWHGINSPTLYAMLQQNPSSKLNSKPHYSSHPTDQTSEFFVFAASHFGIEWGSPARVQLFTECGLRHYIVCFAHVFVDSACKQLTMASSQARNFLRPNNLSGDLADGCVNNFISSLNKSRNRAMCTLL